MEIVTRRFLLREFTDGDGAAFEAYHRDPRSREFAGGEQPGQARALLALFRAWAAERPRRNFQLAIAHRSAPRALLGCCGLRCHGAEAGTAAVGIELAPRYWGRYGYAVEPLRAMVDFGFGVLGLSVLFGGAVSANRRLTRLLSAFGATALARPTPQWMADRGWSALEWRFAREQWLAARSQAPHRRARRRARK